MKFMTFKWETNSIIIINDGTKFTGEDANCELGKEKKKGVRRYMTNCELEKTTVII